MSTSSYESAADPSTVPALSTANMNTSGNASANSSLTKESGDTTIGGSGDIPTTSDKKQSVFDIAENIEKDLNKMLEQLDRTDAEINKRIDAALKKVTSLYDKFD
ncbi:conserved hypothetical protein [Candida dubliniensis CD36]|uniref:Uncharacterized protein n=1 Tax=Candida dubliniensis (strain CD36 / ATCC MYA-646 / CBS 7987 / NCPF 3949 / NRRL Y-17841) TaxID=573826 RepID=B9WN08_CANDC|nr:conserved hypothetical protein [Candida dubliniensis CD36]CAX40475.1 conserved hypothetical protein [Candida dubliniensis CD36]